MSMNISATASSFGMDIISPEMHYILSIIFRSVINPTIVLCALVTNIINVTVFSRFHLKGGVTELFLILSVSDGLTSFLGTVNYVTFNLYRFGPKSITQTSYSLTVLVVAATYIPMYITIFATLVISVVRCFSVVMPLHVKSLISTSRQLGAIFLFTLISCGVQAYGFSFYIFGLHTDPRSNTTQLLLSFTPDFKQRINVVDQYRNVVFKISLAIVTICVSVLTIALRKSSRFRAQSKISTNCDAGNGNPKSNSMKTDRRELQVIKTVLLVAALFVLCSLPVTAMSICRSLIPGFRNVGHLWKSFDVVAMISEFAVCFNAAVNIFVYLNSNSTYKKIFWQMMK